MIVEDDVSRDDDENGDGEGDSEDGSSFQTKVSSSTFDCESFCAGACRLQVPVDCRCLSIAGACRLQVPVDCRCLSIAGVCR